MKVIPTRLHIRSAIRHFSACCRSHGYRNSLVEAYFKYEAMPSAPETNRTIAPAIHACRTINQIIIKQIYEQITPKTACNLKSVTSFRRCSEPPKTKNSTDIYAARGTIKAVKYPIVLSKTHNHLAFILSLIKGFGL